jgi:hypothetical protein
LFMRSCVEMCFASRYSCAALRYCFPCKSNNAHVEGEATGKKMPRHSCLQNVYSKTAITVHFSKSLPEEAIFSWKRDLKGTPHVLGRVKSLPKEAIFSWKRYLKGTPHVLGGVHQQLHACRDGVEQLPLRLRVQPVPRPPRQERHRVWVGLRNIRAVRSAMQ